MVETGRVELHELQVGEGGTGPAIGAGAAATSLTRDEQIDIVTNGGEGMPAFGNVLSPEEIDAVVDYTRDQLGR